MSKILWFFMVIPVILAGGALHWKKNKDKEMFWRLLPKCLATWMMVCTAAVGVFMEGSDKTAINIVFAMLLFLVADALLEIRFMLGVGCFAAGHFLIIHWMLGKSQFRLGMMVLIFTIVIITLVLFHKYLKKELTIYLLVAYSVILAIMMSLAVFLPITGGKKYILIGIGGIGFWISDMFVGKGVFCELTRAQDLFALYLYYFSILCFAVSTWII